MHGAGERLQHIGCETQKKRARVRRGRAIGPSLSHCEGAGWRGSEEKRQGGGIASQRERMRREGGGVSGSWRGAASRAMLFGGARQDGQRRGEARGGEEGTGWEVRLGEYQIELLVGGSLRRAIGIPGGDRACSLGWSPSCPLHVPFALAPHGLNHGLRLGQRHVSSGRAGGRAGEQPSGLVGSGLVLPCLVLPCLVLS